MSQRRVGIFIGLRETSTVGVSYGRTPAVAFSQSQFHSADRDVVAVLAEVLRQIPPEWRNADLALALSAADFECCDCFEVPYSTESAVEAVAGSLAESRCAGSSAEELAIDTKLISGGDKNRVHLAALQRTFLSRLQSAVSEVLPKASLVTVTAAPVAVAEALATRQSTHFLTLESAGECIAVAYKNQLVTAWRSFPVVSPEIQEQARASSKSIAESDEVTVYSSAASDLVELKPGLKVPVQFAPAAAAALIDPERSVNILRAVSDRSMTAGKLSGPFKLLALAAALVFVTAGLYLSRLTEGYKRDVARCDQLEEELWKKVLPAEPYKPGTLNSRMTAALAQHNRSNEVNRYPSALAFWTEMANVMPSPDKIGMSMESLQLGQDGGRFTGKVNRGTGDPLSNAALLESALNNSETLAARGEFETKENEIVVRMRLDYQTKQTVKNGGEK